MASRSLCDLTPYMQERAIKFELQCEAAGVPVLIYCTLRPNAEQDALYAIGRTLPGKIKTNARAGQSSHNPNKDGKAKAFDYVPMVAGKPAWGDKVLYEKTGAIGEALGMKWSGRWSGKLREVAHMSEDGK